MQRFSVYLLISVATLLNFNVHANPFSTEASVTLTSQYLFRGFDVNQEDPALQGDFMVNHESGFSFGVWGSNYDFGNDDGVEVDLMASYETAINDSVSLGFGVTQYTYNGDTDSTTEYYISLSLSQFSFSYYNDTDLDTRYFSIDADFELIDKLSLAIHGGRNDPDSGSSNNDYSISLNYSATDNTSLFTTYSDNSLDTKGAENYLFVGASYSF